MGQLTTALLKMIIMKKTLLKKKLSNMTQWNRTLLKKAQLVQVL
jgi:hypothetical protein